jgi:hypothetical protein
VLLTSRGWRRVEQPTSGCQGRSGGHPGEGAGRGEGAAMQAVAGEAREKQPTLAELGGGARLRRRRPSSSRRVLAGGASNQRAAARGEGASSGDAPTRGKMAAVPARRGWQWRPWVARVEAAAVDGRAGGGWLGGEEKICERGIWGRMGVGGGDPCCFGPSAGRGGENSGRVRLGRVEKLDLSFSTGHG